MVNFVKSAAKQAMENPNLGRAFVYFLMPIILKLVVLVIIGVSINIALFAFDGFFELAGWFLSAIILYIIVHLFKGKEASGKFRGILAGLGFRYVFVFFLLLLIFAVLFIAVPEFFPIVARAQSAQTAEQAYNLIAEGLETISQKSDLVLFSSFSIILLGTILAVLLILYLVYQLIALSGSGSPRLNLLILIIWVGVQAIISAFL